MITKLVDRMIGQEILESENRDEYIYALTIRAEQVITYTLLAMVCLWTHNILEGLIYAVAFKRDTAVLWRISCENLAWLFGGNDCDAIGSSQMDSAFSSSTPDCNDFSSDNQHLCIVYIFTG